MPLLVHINEQTLYPSIAIVGPVGTTSELTIDPILCVHSQQKKSFTLCCLKMCEDTVLGLGAAPGDNKLLMLCKKMSLEHL